MMITFAYLVVPRNLFNAFEDRLSEDKGDEFRLIVAAELIFDISGVGFHRSSRQLQFLAYLFGGKPSHHALDNFLLPRGQQRGLMALTFAGFFFHLPVSLWLILETYFQRDLNMNYYKCKINFYKLPILMVIFSDALDCFLEADQRDGG